MLLSFLKSNLLLIYIKTRKSLGQTIGVQLTSSVFTAIGSQIPAERAGYTTDAEVSYDEVENKLGYKFPGNTMKSLKLMSLRCV